MLPNEITDRLYHFYPVGLSNLTNYDGLREIDDLVNNKIDVECNDAESSINRLFGTLTSLAPDLAWGNINYLYFPAYLVDCLVREEEITDINHQLKLQITISLLCDFYTLFCYDQYGFRDQNGNLQFRAVYTIYSFEHTKRKLPNGLLGAIETEINKFYPKKRFISHYDLMNTKVTGALPYKKDPSIYPASSVFSVYQLLFHDLFEGDHRILA